MKRTLSLSIFCRNRSLFRVLKIEQLTQIYLNHKIFFFRKIFSYDFILVLALSSAWSMMPPLSAPNSVQSGHVRPIALISFSTVLRQVALGLACFFFEEYSCNQASIVRHP